MQLDTAVLSETGGRERNEDACGYWVSEAGSCWVVSDGAGGHAGGDIAAKSVVSSVLRGFAAAPAVTAETIAQLMQSANQAIVTEQQRQPRLRDMRSTAVILCIDAQVERAIWGHVGDSRLYCYRLGRLLHRTRDHSVMQSMVEAGYADPSLLRSAPQRSLLLSALGSMEDFDISVADELLDLRDGDAFLLCTDGFWEYVEESRMQHALDIALSARGWLDAMQHELVGRARVDHDNYTGLAVWIGDPSQATRQLDMSSMLTFAREGVSPRAE